MNVVIVANLVTKRGKRMNLIDIQVENITNVETDLPYNSVRITADFYDDGGKYLQETRIIHKSDYQKILLTGEYQG